MILTILSLVIILGGVSAFTFYIAHKYGKHHNKHTHA
jgi:heme/copper-type cytochrome/quinol oxidase subunit 2